MLTPSQMLQTASSGPPAPGARGAAPRADGRFEILGLLPGRYVVSVAMPRESTWALGSVAIGAAGPVDDELEIGAEDLTDVVLTCSDTRSHLSGTLETAPGLPATDYFVVVYPADPTLRHHSARRIKVVRPASDGRYVFEDLPPGDYFVGVLADLEAGELSRADFLDELVPDSVRVTLRGAEQVVQNLRIGGQR
jgi:hypothetical protein